MSASTQCACGCGLEARPNKKFRQGHWAKANRILLGQMRRTNRPSAHGDGYTTIPGDVQRRKLTHVAVAEAAIGRALPRGAVVHHINGVRDDNRPSNLVVCPSHAYHALLHRRQRALDACGNAEWRKCPICKQYDHPGKMRTNFRGSTFVHPSCAARMAAVYRSMKKEKSA